MNINKRTHRLISATFFILLITFLQNSFGNNIIIDSAVIKITDTEINAVNLVFEKSQDKKLIIENHLAKDVHMGNLFFVSNEFTAPLIARGISTRGYTDCSTIAAGTSCSFVVNAAKNASPSTDPDGEHLLLNYKIANEEEDKFFPLEIKINYNNDITFEVGKAEFNDITSGLNKQCYGLGRATKTFDDSYCQNKLPKIKKMTLINKNSLYSLNIRRIKPTQNEIGIWVGNHGDCLNLKSGDSCEVVINIDPETNDDVIPIYVNYDIVDENGAIINKDLTAATTTAVKEAETQIIKAITDGAVMAGIVKLVYNSYVPQYIKPIFVAIIGEGQAAVDFATSSALGFFSGFVFPIAHDITRTVGNFLGMNIEYDDSIRINKIVETTVMQSMLGSLSCQALAAKKPGTFLKCMAVYIGSGLFAVFATSDLAEMYSGLLPPQLEKSLNALIKATIRVVYRGDKAPNGGATEVWQEILSTIPKTSIPGIKDLEKSFFQDNSAHFNATVKNGIMLIDQNCMHDECICTSLSR